MKRIYPSDLSDNEWSALKPLLSMSENRRGPKRKWTLRSILNAIFYVLKTGCQWRYLPKTFAPWQTVYYHFRQWKRKGWWFVMHERVRLKLGRHEDPSAAILDS